MGFVPAHLYKGRASELQQWQRFRLDHAQAYLYKPGHRSCKNVGASPAVSLGYTSSYTCTWLSLSLSLTNTCQAHLYKLGIGDSKTAMHPLSVDPFSGTLYKPRHQRSKNVCSPAAAH